MRIGRNVVFALLLAGTFGAVSHAANEACQQSDAICLEGGGTLREIALIRLTSTGTLHVHGGIALTTAPSTFPGSVTITTMVVSTHPWVDPLAYGVIPDDANDDLAGFTSALAAAANGTMILPEGVYRISGPLEYDTAASGPLTIMGLGAGAEIINEGNSNATLHVTGTAGVTRSYFNLYNAKFYTDTTGTSTAAIHLDGITNFHLRDVIIDGNSKTTNGILLTGSQQGEISGGYNTNSVVGIRSELSGAIASNGVEMHGISLGNSSWSFVLDGVDTAMIHDNHVTGGGGVLVTGGGVGLLMIRNNIFEPTNASTQTCVWLSTAANQTTITENVFAPPNAENAIYILGGNAHTIKNNLINGQVYFDTAMQRGRFKDNYMSGGAGAFTDNSQFLEACGNIGPGNTSILGCNFGGDVTVDQGSLYISTYVTLGHSASTLEVLSMNRNSGSGAILNSSRPGFTLQASGNNLTLESYDGSGSIVDSDAIQVSTSPKGVTIGTDLYVDAPAYLDTLTQSQLDASTPTQAGGLVYNSDDGLVYKSTGSALGEFAALSSVGELNDLSDVDVTGAITGQVIKYNSGSGNWELGSDNDSGAGASAWIDGGSGTVYISTLNVAMGVTDAGSAKLNVAGQIYSTGTFHIAGSSAVFDGSILTIGGSTFVVTGGNVGVGGNVSPGYTLDASSQSIAYATATVNGVLMKYPVAECGDGQIWEWTAASDEWTCGDDDTGGAGASTLAIATGIASGFGGTVVSSPTAVINFSSSTFTGSLPAGSTAFVSLNPSSVTLAGPTINATEMADDDHGDVSWSGGSATVDNVAAENVAAGSLGAGVIASSITLAAMYGAPTLTGTNFTSIPGAQVTDGVPAANIAAGSLDGDVIASSITAASIYTVDPTVIQSGSLGSGVIASSVAVNSVGISAMQDDAISSAEMADDDHGDVSWSGGSATVDNVAAENVAAGSLGASVLTSSITAASIYTVDPTVIQSGSLGAGVIAASVTAASIYTVDDDVVVFDDGDSNFSATSIGAAVEEFDDVNGSGPNAADGKVEWSQIVGMPAGFADGTDASGGGESTLGVATGTASGFEGTISSPTAVIVFSSSTFIGQLPEGSTGYIALNPSSVTMAGPTIESAEMGDDDHGDVSWSGGSATVDNVAAANVAAGPLGASVIASSITAASIYTVDDDVVQFDDADSNFTATTIGAAIEELDDDNASGPNASDGKVEWSQLVGVPAGFADETDDTAVGGGDNLGNHTATETLKMAEFGILNIASMTFAGNSAPVLTSTFTTLTFRVDTGTTVVKVATMTIDGSTVALIGATAGGQSGFLGSNVIVSSVAVGGFYDNDTVRTNLGLAIGSDVQAYDATLADLASAPLSEADSVDVGAIAAGTLPTDVLASSVALAGFYDDDAVRTALGLAIGSDVQAYDATLADLAAAPLTEDNSIDPTAIAAGSVPSDVIITSITLAAMYGSPTLTGTNFTSIPGAQVTDGVPAANIAAGSLDSDVIASSITLASMYGAPTLTGTNFTSIPGAQVTDGVPAANIAAGSLDTDVIASSITLAAMYGAPTLTGTNFTSIPGAQVTDGVPAANIAAGSLDTDVIAASVTAASIYTVDDDVVVFDDADSNFTATEIGPAIEELDDANASGPNASDGKVNWEQLVNMPAGFADGTDASGGGESTLAIATGISSGFGGTVISSPTAVINFSSSQFSGALPAGSTAFITLNTSSVTMVGPFVDGGSGGDITDGSVTADDLGTDSVSADELNATGVEAELEAVLDLDQLQGTISDTQIADGAVDGGAGGEIADGSIVGADVDASSFTMVGPFVDGGSGGDITDGSITADDLGTDSVSADELNATGVEAELETVLDLNELQGQIGDAQIADGAVDGGTGGEIADGSITGADVNTSSFTMLGIKIDGNATEVDVASFTLLGPTIELEEIDGQALVNEDFAVCVVTPAALGTVATLVSPFRNYAVTITTISAQVIGGTNAIFMIEQRTIDGIESAGTDIWTGDVTAVTTSWTGGTSSDFTIPADSALVLVMTSTSGDVDRLMIKYRISRD